jgi:hypothetical protein
MWEQGKKDNPKPESMIPQVVTGFNGLLERFRAQQAESEHQSLCLDVLSDAVERMREKSLDLRSKADGLRSAQRMLSHRIVRVLCKQEILRRYSQSLGREEEELLAPMFSRLCRTVGIPVVAGLDLLVAKNEAPQPAGECPNKVVMVPI